MSFAALYIIRKDSSKLLIVMGTTKLDLFTAFNQRNLALALSVEGGNP